MGRRTRLQTNGLRHHLPLRRQKGLRRIRREAKYVQSHRSPTTPLTRKTDVPSADRIKNRLQKLRKDHRAALEEANITPAEDVIKDKATPTTPKKGAKKQAVKTEDTEGDKGDEDAEKGIVVKEKKTPKPKGTPNPKATPKGKKRGAKAMDSEDEDGMEDGKAEKKVKVKGAEEVKEDEEMDVDVEIEEEGVTEKVVSEDGVKEETNDEVAVADGDAVADEDEVTAEDVVADADAE